MPTTLSEWLERQETVHVRSIDLGLERVSAVARKLGLTRPAYRVITVAGTNGKGSTVAHLEAILLAHGYRAGSLTSPHLLRYNERVRIDGSEAGDAELVRAFDRIEAARGKTTLTFFEYNALAALIIFADRKIDVAVLEVGLGGRLDAVNIIDADVAVLCSVGFDHRDWLGDTLDAIGAEKAGIFRSGRPAVLGTPQMPASVFAAAEIAGARLAIAERDFSWSTEGDHWSYRGLAASLDGLPSPALAGSIQYRNAATALAAFESLGGALRGALDGAFDGAFDGARRLDVGKVAEALRAVRLPGRFQTVRVRGVEWILDVAHNEPAAQVLAENLRSRRPEGSTYAVCSILRDKDVEAVGRAVAPAIDEWILCGTPGPRGSSASELAARLVETVAAPRLSESVREGLNVARSLACAGDRVVVFGSFVTVTSALEWLEASAAPGGTAYGHAHAHA